MAKFKILGILLLSCGSNNDSTVVGVTPKMFCLDVQETKKRNDIAIGKGTLTLSSDMTFNILNDSSKFSNIKGEWDSCCQTSGWKNYFIKPSNHIRQMVSSSEFEIKVDNKIYTLIFVGCK